VTLAIPAKEILSKRVDQSILLFERHLRRIFNELTFTALAFKFFSIMNFPVLTVCSEPHLGHFGLSVDIFLYVNISKLG